MGFELVILLMGCFEAGVLLMILLKVRLHNFVTNPKIEENANNGNCYAHLMDLMDDAKEIMKQAHT